MAQKPFKSKPGRKHRILFVRHRYNRLWRVMLLADIIIWILWWGVAYIDSYFSPPNDIYLMYFGLGLFVLMLVVFFMRNRGFVQAKTTYVLLALPLFRIRIPYTQIENVRLVLYKDIYEKIKLSGATKRFMRPYQNQTMTAIVLNEYPVPPWMLHSFLPKYLFLPTEKGFIVYIQHYLDFNTEVDSHLNQARGETAVQPTRKDKEQDDQTYDGYFNLFD